MNSISVGHRTLKVAAPVLLLISLFVAMLLLIGLSGNFPLNDDWSYGEGVRHLLHGHGLVMPTVCAPGMAHVALGFIAAKVFGYSYTSLRLCSFVITFIGALALFDAAASMRIPRRDAAFIALVYAANPVLINVAFSFMSDSTGLALNLIFLACLLRAQAQKSVKMALVAFFFLLMAISVRQSALIFLALAPFCLSSNLASTKHRHLILAAVFTLPLISAWSCDYWLTHRPSTLGFVNNDYQMVRQSHAAVVNKLLTAPHHMFLPTISAMGQLLCYLALYTLPALMAFLWLIKEAKKWSATTIKVALIVVLSLLASALLTVLNYHQTMPFAENIWRVTTIGAQGLLGIIRKPVPERRRMLLTIFSFVMTVPLTLTIVSMFRGVFKKPLNWRLAAISSCLLASFAFLTIETLVRCTDRYYLIALAPMLLCLGLMARRYRISLVNPLTVLLLVLLSAYSIAGNQEYLSSNRARWLAIEWLESRGVEHHELDGGCEYNVLRDLSVYNSKYRGEPPRDSWRWWPIKGENYLISYSPVPGYKMVHQEPYYSLLDGKTHNIEVLEKESD